ncbi:extracellular solute-binding protein [Nocardioides sp.]|uniref:ABC transporter substrate-binding protein n=1 Tax=Nocardioides sp. TaxID=35761 RepID=UPI00286B4BDD|nr:extracellular solute-binding protein [Nocardioides sp.]
MRRGLRDVRRPRAAAVLLAGVLALSLAVAGCDADQQEPSPAPPTQTSPPAKPTDLTFGVWGAAAEVAAYQAMVDDYNTDSETSQIELLTWPTHDAFVASMQDGEVPDLYLVSRGDLAMVQEEGLNQPLLELLDERGVNYTDDYARDALLAFSADNELQCMPYGISPMVIYYNTELIDFDRMLARELPAPEDDPETPEDETRDSWTFEQFTAAAEFATRPRRGSAGVYIEPTLHGLAPFVYSGGGDLFDDDNEPTSLALSEDDSRDALSRTLELLRDASVTLSNEQLAEASPMEWFERGKLGMIAGFRSLTPELREVDGLSFDVMPMPTLDRAATIGDITGLCVSSDAPSVARAADFLVHAVSAEPVARVARAGYLAPASLPVAVSEDFLQPALQPEHADVFRTSIDDMVVPPLLDDYTALEAAVSGSLRLLLSVTVPDLEALTTQVDEQSRTVLDPELASPSESASEDAD